MKNSNCLLIGLDAGINLTDEENIVIIGDGISDLNRKQKNVLFIGNSCAIGETIMGQKINLKEVLEKCLNNAF